MRTVISVAVIVLTSTLTSLLFGEESGLVARWDFDDGSGVHIKDSSGLGNQGTIHGAKRVALGNGYALRFDGVDDYVNCGNGESLNLLGPLTLEAWVKPEAPPRGEPGILGKFYESYAITFYRGSAWFYISGGGNALKSGLTMGEWQHVVAVFDGKMMHLYFNGRRVATKESLRQQTAPGQNFLLGCVVGDSENIDPALRNTAFFTGLIDGVSVYSRPLGELEIIERYNQQATEKKRPAIDVARLGQLLVTPYIYPEHDYLVADVDCQWVRPLPKDPEVEVVLSKMSGGQPVEVARQGPLKLNAHSTIVEASFPTEGLGKGEFQLAARMKGYQGSTKFQWPAKEPVLPCPTDHVAAPLPRPVLPPQYAVDVTRQGGIRLLIDGRAFLIESTFSYPHGGENGLTVGTRADLQPEPRWNVKVRKRDSSTHQVSASGAYYSIDRTVRQTATRIEVEDTFTNTTDEVLGIILSNHLNLRELPGARPTIHANATVFAANESRGVGLVALDDVYFLQMENGVVDGLARLKDPHFGLASGASYTVKWAIYPTASENYYDFINQVRHDEGLNGHVPGGLTLSTGWVTPSQEEVRNKGLALFSQCLLTRIKSNPTISLEGWEFLEYPEVADRVRRTLVATREAYPEMKVGFHVAHSLYAMNDPERFADSKAIDEAGNQIHYGPNTMDYYGRYFSKELVEDNWRWWIFYPTMENSFGKVMLQGADMMIDDLGANFIWADGYIEGYVREGYVYDHFDGHSVTIDPKTKLVTRQKANVTLVALPVLKAVARKFSDAGGTLVSNGNPGPPSYWQEQTITSNETGGGDQIPVDAMHLARTVTPLGNPEVVHCERDVYQDVLTKLNLGALYFYYGETDHRPGGHNFITRQGLVTHMFPITFERIEPGVVTGRERIVTNRSGVYGWPDDFSLHQVFFSDARGQIVPSRCTTTIDQAGARTELVFSQDESAVVAKIPGTCSTNGTVNLRVDQYLKSGLSFLACGQSKIQITLSDGKLPVRKGKRYLLTVDGTSREIRASEDRLIFEVNLDGLSLVRLEPK